MKNHHSPRKFLPVAAIILVLCLLLLYQSLGSGAALKNKREAQNTASVFMYAYAQIDTETLYKLYDFSGMSAESEKKMKEQLILFSQRLKGECEKKQGLNTIKIYLLGDAEDLQEGQTLEVKPNIYYENGDIETMHIKLVWHQSGWKVIF